MMRYQLLQSLLTKQIGNRPPGAVAHPHSPPIQPHVTHSMGARAKFKLQFDVLHLQAVRICLAGGSSFETTPEKTRQMVHNGAIIVYLRLTKLSVQIFVYINVLSFCHFVILLSKTNTKLIIINNNVGMVRYVQIPYLLKRH